MNRREFLRDAGIVLVGVGALSLLSACAAEEEERLTQKPKEIEGIPKAGDLIITSEGAFLLRIGKRYPISDLRIYARNTKLERYGRKILYLPQGSLGEYSIGDVSRKQRIWDGTTRTEKINNPSGQEILVFFPGFMTDGGMPYETIKPAEDTFVNLLVGLKPKKWGLENSFFFTYGKERLIEYEAKHTARSPEENMRHAIDFIGVLKEEFPLAQFNIICHSLGGLFGLAAAQKHFDAINNLILINSPIRGIEGNLFRKGLVGAGRKLLEPYIGDEKVSDYLFRIWGSKEYQEKLEKFVSFFTSIGRKIIVVTDESDPIVPVESTLVKGVKEIRLAKT
ncbi:MAG: hypothetical protein Q8Q96_01265, partial [bacterium]|nr:hypothetical protein [bacterium]